MLCLKVCGKHGLLAGCDGLTCIRRLYKITKSEQSEELLSQYAGENTASRVFLDSGFMGKRTTVLKRVKAHDEELHKAFVVT